MPPFLISEHYYGKRYNWCGGDRSEYFIVCDAYQKREKLSICRIGNKGRAKLSAMALAANRAYLKNASKCPWPARLA
jgi:hypothetical protein